MRHSEIAEPPGERGDNRKRSVRRACIIREIVDLREGEISRNALGVFNNSADTARVVDTENHDDKQRDSHTYTLDKVGGAGSKKSADTCVGDDDHRA